MEMLNLDWKKVLNKISTYCSCPQSRAALQDILPYSHASIAQNNMGLIYAFQRMFGSGGVRRISLLSFEGGESWLYAIKKSQALKTSDLNQVRLFFEDIYSLRESYKWDHYDEITQIKDRFINPETALNYINQLISESGEIRSDASPTLFDAFKEKKSLSNKVHKILDALVKDFSLEKVLQDKYVTTREGRWVLPVISGKQHDFKGIIHDSSHSKQTVFMEPEEVIQLNNKIKMLEDDIKFEIERLLKEISIYFFEIHMEIQKAFDLAVEVDKLSSIALWANDYRALPITLSSSSKLFSLKEVFHPLLLDETKNPIKNDFELREEENILLLSGPNAGGKTVFLKSVGLACHMARCGLPVCAHSQSQMPFFTTIRVIIGDLQSVEESLSTFAAHLKQIDQSSKLKGPENLILIDEICGSTEAGEGSALARAFLEELSKNKVRGFITSHLGPLKSGWSEDSGVINGSMVFDQKNGSPTFEFVKGIPGDSLALETAKKVGVDKNIVERALFFLSPEQRKKYSGLVEIESLQESLKKEKTTYLDKQKELDQLKREYKDMINSFSKQQDELLEFSLSRVQSSQNQSDNYDRIKKLMANRKNIDLMKSTAPQVNKINNTSTTQTVITKENFEEKFPAGTQVYVPSLKRNGVVQGRIDSKGFVPVLSESMRLQIKWDELRKPGNQNNESKKISTPIKHVLEGRVENKIDVRGMTVEDALEKLEDAIDKSLRFDCDRIKVVHGHGTDALKKNIRSFLSRHPSIKTWKTGSTSGENDGVTVGVF